MGERKSIWDFMDIPTLQKLQDGWSKALGFAFVTVDYKGVPVTEYSGFSPYCMLGRTMQGFAEMCEQCDAHGGLHAAITGQPYIYRCHADLVDFSMPLILDGIYVGALLGGQVRLNQSEERMLERIIPCETRWRDMRPDLADAYTKAEQVTYEKVEASVMVVRDLILHLIQQKNPTVPAAALAEKDQELRNERAARTALEATLRTRENIALGQQGEFRYFYFVMNIIARLAFEEGANRTEAIAYDYADLMRYTTDATHKSSTLGEELNFIGCVLRIRKAWMGDALTFSISVPERYWSTPCPFMVMHSIIEAALLCMGETVPNQRKIDISIEEIGEDVCVKVCTNGERLSLEELESKLSDTVEDSKISIFESDRSLKRMFGKRYGISIDDRQDGNQSIDISFRLPMQ